MPLNFYEGLKVLDLGQGISAPFCARMFADLGAQVVKVEPPEGDPARALGPFPGDVPHPERSGLFLALNTNKLGITLNLGTESGRSMLLQLVDEADLLVENYPPGYLTGLGLDFPSLHQRNPGLVFMSVTLFGHSGPWAGYQANNLIVSNLSGHSRGHPGPVDDPARQPPLQLAAHQAEFIAGLSAASAAALALNRRRHRGTGCHMDVSAVEALAVLPQSALAEYALGIPPKGRRKDQAGRLSLLALLPCRDGYVGISPRQQDQWERMVELMGNPQWARDPRFATTDLRLENWDHLESRLREWTLAQDKEAVYRGCQARHIPSFPLNTAADLFRSPQLQAREFFVSSDHPEAGRAEHPGWPFHLASGRRVELAPAPLLGQHNRAVLGEPGLGLRDQQLAALRALDVI